MMHAAGDTRPRVHIGQHQGPCTRHITVEQGCTQTYTGLSTPLFLSPMPVSGLAVESSDGVCTELFPDGNSKGWGRGGGA